MDDWDEYDAMHELFDAVEEFGQIAGYPECADDLAKMLATEPAEWDRKRYGHDEGTRCPACGFVVVTGLCCNEGRTRRAAGGSS